MPGSPLRDRRPARAAGRPPRAVAGGAGGGLHRAESGRVPPFAGRLPARGIDVPGYHRGDLPPQYLRGIEQAAHLPAAGITRDRQMRTQSSTRSDEFARWNVRAAASAVLRRAG